MNKGIAMAERLEGRVLMSFSTVDAFELSAGHTSQALAIVADPAGDVFAVGNAYNASNLEVGIIREKAAGSSTWNTINSFSYPSGSSTSFWGAAIGPDGSLYVTGGGGGHWVTLKGGSGGFSIIDDFVTSGGALGRKVAFDASGDVYVVGQASTVQGKGANVSTTSNWVVRRRLAGQTSFTTVDNFTTPGSGASPIGLTTVPSGPAAGVYVVGDDSAANGSLNWIVRKSGDAGSTWATVDTFQLTPGVGCEAEGVTADAAGNLFVAGLGSASSNLMLHWIVRESSDGGTTWSTSDNYRLSATKNAVATSAALDNSGHVYVTGYGIDANNVRHAILRTNAGGSWQTADDFQSGAAATYAAFTADAAGNLYVAGNGQDASGVGEWIVRSASAPAPSAAAAAANAFSSTPIATGSSWLRHRTPRHLAEPC